MKKTYLLYLGGILCFPFVITAQTFTENGETFKLDTLYPNTGTTGMNSPWEIVYGPDDSLWVTEAHNYKVWKIHPGNKGNRVLLDLSANKDFTNPPAWPQGGLMGLAIHPGFYSGKPWVYIAYVYHLVGCGMSSGGTYCSYNTKIVRYNYNSSDGSLTYMDDVISGLDGSNDHNSGRLRISPLPESDGNYHLYYTIGDMGAGNLANIDRQNNAQDTTILEGKVLRLNTEPDAAQSGGAEWIPDDNPFPAGAAATAKSAIYSYGHRNPQGLVFGSVDGRVTYHLYSSEHGDQSDDEINIIWPHTNYGWPKVAGLCDDNYTSTDGDSMYLAGKAVISESGFCDTTPTILQEPIFSFYNWSRAANKISGALGNMSWPTIAPASIAFYDGDYIPGWKYSLLVPSLKNGLFRLKLKADGLTIDSSGVADTIHYLAGYRLRNITVAPTGDTLFLAVDNSCCTIGSPGTIGNSVASPDPGYILRMVFLTTLALKDSVPPPRPDDNRTYVKIYPNPASKYLYVDCKEDVHNPLLAQLYDMTGQLVLQKTTSQDSFSLDIHGLRPGMYVLKLYGGNAEPIITEKIIIF